MATIIQADFNLSAETPKLHAYIQNIHRESDRGAVLSLAAVLEDMLKEILLSFLKDNKSSQKLLEGFNAPVGTFSSKILLTHALGLITDQEHIELQKLRKLRNLFAHTWDNLTLETPNIKIIVLSLPLPKTLVLNEDVKNEARKMFNVWSSIFLTRLIGRYLYCLKNKITERTFDNLAHIELDT